jgi:hypothetical protein
LSSVVICTLSSNEYLAELLPYPLDDVDVANRQHRWGDRHSGRMASIRMIHVACRAPAEAVVTCTSCGHQLGPGDMVAKASLARY